MSISKKILLTVTATFFLSNLSHVAHASELDSELESVKAYVSDLINTAQEVGKEKQTRARDQRFCHITNEQMDLNDFSNYVGSFFLDKASEAQRDAFVGIAHSTLSMLIRISFEYPAAFGRPPLYDWIITVTNVSPEEDENQFLVTVNIAHPDGSEDAPGTLLVQKKESSTDGSSLYQLNDINLSGPIKDMMYRKFEHKYDELEEELEEAGGLFDESEKIDLFLEGLSQDLHRRGGLECDKITD